MSYDLIFFSPKDVPQGQAAFLAWFKSTPGSEEDFRHPGAESCDPRLRELFDELRTYLPWQEDSPDSQNATDYAFARHMIRGAFPLSSRKTALDTALALCWRLGIGLYDLGGSGAVHFPETIWDVIEARRHARRPWWKIWRS